MRVLCVDDALPVLEDTMNLCRKLQTITEVTGFTRPVEASEWLKTHPVDLALLDIDMPKINGIQFARQIKTTYPNAAVIFLTAFPQYAVDAFKLHASGYLLKPVILEELEAEVEYARKYRALPLSGHIVVKTFGYFEIYVNGETMAFSRSKSKELLAYLIDQHGKGVTRSAIFAALWEEGMYDHSKQKYLDVIIRSLRDTLRKYSIDEILEIKSGFIRIRPELLDCDLYRYLNNDPAAVRSYRGDYMSGYDWAFLGRDAFSGIHG